MVKKGKKLKTAFFAILMTIVCPVAQAQDVGGAFTILAEDNFHLVGGSMTFGFGQVSQQAEFDAFGSSMDLSLVGKVGTYAGLPLYLEWAQFIGQASGHAASTKIQGSDNLVYTSGSSPVGTIDLATLVDRNGATSSVAVQIIDSTGDVASIVSSAFSPDAQASAVSQFAVSQTDSGGVFSALTTNGQTGLGSAYGAVFDDTGFLFLGTGNNCETAMMTSIDERIVASNQTVFLSTVFPINEQWSVSPRLGPTFRDLKRTSTQRTTIDLNEGSGLEATLPDIFMAERTSLKSEYRGVILGADFTQQVRENMLFNFGAEAGLAKFSARYSQSNTIDILGANVEIPGSIARSSGAAALARITADLTHVSRNGTIVTLGAFVDYLSDAPYLTSQTTSRPSLSESASAVGLSGNGETYRTYSIESKSMLNVGISLSAVVLF
tara:strand:+ start:3822 stop:5132 length:1311 start_codon:yes stop_codon:yes gene_type:complete